MPRHAHPPAREAGSDPDRSDLKQRVDRAADELARGVDREANFHFLYQSFYRPLQRFFTFKGFAPHDALDLTQETFVGIYTGMKTYRHSGRFEGWLYQVATNAALKRRRMQGTVKRSAPEVSYEEVQEAVKIPAESTDPLDTLLDDERRETMRRAIGELPKQMRQCMTLHLYQGLSYPDIAVTMRINVNTVKAHMFQGRKKLVDMLGELALGELGSGAAE
ncbi:MAG: RNA polymerase sigma factor [Acidobacteriota bacterium]